MYLTITAQKLENLHERSSFPKPTLHGHMEEGIEETSLSFIEIFGQVQEAEALGLTTLVGIGYRKAIEFLIKDYLCGKYPDKAEKIKKKSLGQCISDDVDDPNLKTCAERATWLGNDETHYVRKWLDRNVEDLKILLSLTKHWVSSAYLTKEYENRMPRHEKDK